MNFPLVTIIIPTYKRTDYLKLTLDSILQQSFQDFEIIVIDDGTPSEDNFILCQKYEKLHYIKIENSRGPAKPRNVGIQEANGKYVAFIDDDDLWSQYKLEKQVRILEDNPEFGLVHSYCNIIDENTIQKGEIVGKPRTPNVKHGDVSMKMIGNWTLMTSSVLLRRNVIEKIGLFNEKMPPAGEDAEYWIRCSFFTKFYYIDEPLVQYRIHTNNISNEAKQYVDLSLYFKKVLVKFISEKVINKNQYDTLLNNLCAMQIKMIKKYSYKSFINLFSLNPAWMLKKSNLKLFIFVLIKR